MPKLIAAVAFAASLAGAAFADDEGMEHHHDHPAPEHLGRVSFPTSCAPAVQARFDRAVALLHSFAYARSHQAFAEVLVADPDCAMAAWGEAMTHYHQLWEPFVDSRAQLAEATQEIGQAARLADKAHASPRERTYIDALGLYFRDAATTAHPVRAQRYSDAMAIVARDNPGDDEAQVFYALSLIATASPADRTHADYKRAAAILEPLWRKLPDHPGIAHYLIHADDSAEMAPRGLAAARAYSRIAPAAPHALHMPSHIFTRLGLWRDSIASNEAARAAAHAQGDISQEMHAMDYLTYAELQLGHVAAARKAASQADAVAGLAATTFAMDYATNAMPARVAVETGDWAGAARLSPRAGASSKTAAMVWWARAVGHARNRPTMSAEADIGALTQCRDKLAAAGDAYWASETDVLVKSATAWTLKAKGDSAAAIASLRAAADEEDALEKVNVTPGPIVPAREQLGELLLADHRPAEALKAFKTALANAPGRRGALEGAAAAARQSGRTAEAARFRRQLASQS